MRLFNTLLLLLLVLSFTHKAESAEAILSLRIDAPESEIKSGGPVKLHLVLTNTSKQDISFNDTNDFCDYSVNVVAETGQKAPETALRKDIQCIEDDSEYRLTGRTIPRSLKPGESHESTLDVSEFNEMIVPGVYSVKVTRILRTPGKSKAIGRFTSNVISVTIISD